MTKDQAMLVKTSLALALLARSAQAVIDNWEKGDLAEAVRKMDEDVQVAIAVFGESDRHFKKRRT